jgi:AcrR family transcriptional regulator
MSAEETQDRLIDALLRQAARGGIEALSVRAIAAEAGVNHGLVHRHFGSKEGLVRAAIARTAGHIVGGGAAGIAGRTFAVLSGAPEIARVVARACLDGPHDDLALAGPGEEGLAAIVRPIERALAALGVRGVSGEVVNGLVASALLGWFVFRPLLERAYGIGPRADAEVARLLELVDRALAPSTSRALPPTSARSRPTSVSRRPRSIPMANQERDCCSRISDASAFVTPRKTSMTTSSGPPSSSSAPSLAEAEILARKETAPPGRSRPHGRSPRRRIRRRGRSVWARVAGGCSGCARRGGLRELKHRFSNSASHLECSTVCAVFFRDRNATCPKPNLLRLPRDKRRVLICAAHGEAAWQS